MNMVVMGVSYDSKMNWEEWNTGSFRGRLKARQRSNALGVAGHANRGLESDAETD